MKEIVIISGKGGTGKTTIAASLATLAQGCAVLADCDVDAADLHLILQPAIRKTTEFRSGHKAVINNSACTGCGTCLSVCRFDAVQVDKQTTKKPLFKVDSIACEGCGVCVRHCPVQAILFPENHCGEWYESDTRFGPLVHAGLSPAAENSGRLVTILRTRAKAIAEAVAARFVIIDGSPGIGCPVIASLTGADAALIVTEPTVSGSHDFMRIAELALKLGIPSMVCVNKWDINPLQTSRIQDIATKYRVENAGNIRYGSAASEAQSAGKSIIEFDKAEMAQDIRKIWQNLLLFVMNKRNEP